MESCQSGLSCLFAKEMARNRARRFESFTLRFLLSGRLAGRTRDFGSRNVGSNPTPTTLTSCSGGGIGRHEGLKIPWPLAVRVRVPLRVQLRGVDQLVDRLVWDQEAVGSSPATPTNLEAVSTITSS
jgi:hypothetical protein